MSAGGVLRAVGSILLIALAGCGGGDDGDDSTLSVEGTAGGTTTDSALPACADVEQMVAFTIFGAATQGDPDEETRWMDDPEAQPVARSGAADVAKAYRELGYGILYVSSLPSGTQIGDQPLMTALTVWLGLNGFPIGEDASQVWAWDGEGDASVALVEELVVMKRTGIDVVTGYTGDPEMVQPLASGGIPRDRLFTLGAAASDDETRTTSTSLPEDFEEHLLEVQALDPVCE